MSEPKNGEEARNRSWVIGRTAEAVWVAWRGDKRATWAGLRTNTKR